MPCHEIGKSAHAAEKGNEPSQLSPESTSYQTPRDVLGAVWSQGGEACRARKAQKQGISTRPTSEGRGKKTRRVGGGTAASLVMGTGARGGGGRQNHGKTGLNTQENGCEKGRSLYTKGRHRSRAFNASRCALSSTANCAAAKIGVFDCVTPRS